MEIQAGTPQRQTLKEMLEYPSSSSPRGVLDGPFDYCTSVYADTMSICTRLLHDDDTEDEVSVSGFQSLRCFFSLKEVVLRRLSTFPWSRHYSQKLLQSCRFKKATLKFSKVTPFSAESNTEPGLSKNGWRQFSYNEIAAATECFNSENLIGRGGYADVYKGCLPSGQLVAVKMLIRGAKEEQGTSFLTELGVLGHVCHPNTTALLGFCIENGLFLVFEFFPFGSLATMLHGLQVMEWAARFKVAIGTAKGLHYLHTNCKRRIIHRDIKASNILLGPDFEPQITEFGLAKWLPSEWTHHTVPVEGTFGYLAPEYFMHGIVDEKTDVFAFGVLLLELITGLRPIDSFQKSLVMKVKPLLESGNVQQLVDGRLRGVYNVNEMQRTILAARHCVRQSAIARPSMEDVVKLLVEERTEFNFTAHSSSLWDKCGQGEDENLVLSCQQREMNRYAALAFGSCT